MRRVRPQHLYGIEAALVGLFFIQALRFLIGMLYSRVAGATAVLAVDPGALDPSLPGMVDPAVVRGEVMFTVYMLLLPLLALVLGRSRLLLGAAGALVAIGRLAMLATPEPTTGAAALTVGAGLLYAAMLIRHRASALPYMFLLGLGIDQLLRAAGNTLDPSWFRDTFVLGTAITYLHVQLVLSVVALVLAGLNALTGQRRTRDPQSAVSAERATLTFWGALAFGAILYLELSLLALPNAVAGRAGADYTTFVPLLLAATVLPLVPWVRAQARSFIAMFDGSVRGWAWMLITALLIVFGTRLSGLAAGAALVLAQLAISLLWWWLARPQAEKERNLTGFWMIVAVLIFVLLAGLDFFTYEYAYVRDLGGGLESLNEVVPPLLRGLRGMGLGVILLAVLFSAMPMALAQRRIPWAERRATPTQSLITLVLVIALSVGAAIAARPPVIVGLANVESFRTATYNIHGGFSEFFDFDLEAIARTIQQSGAEVVMLQEVEAGRMTSFGVDQPLWLARRLGMDRRFFPTNEGLQGLATLSRMPIVYHRGTLLPSIGQQTGVQHVQITPDGVSAIALYNTWLGLLLDVRPDQTLAQQEQDQQNQLAALLGLIVSDYADEFSRARIIVAGTFNNVPGSPLLEQMRVNSGFRDAFAGMPLELAATFVRTGTVARFDYIWLSRTLEWIGAGVMDTAASDHRLAVVEVLLDREAR